MSVLRGDTVRYDMVEREGSERDRRRICYGCMQSWLIQCIDKVY